MFLEEPCRQRKAAYSENVGVVGNIFHICALHNELCNLAVKSCLISAHLKTMPRLESEKTGAKIGI